MSYFFTEFKNTAFNKLSDFKNNIQGSMAIVLSIASLPLVLAAGVGIDYSRQIATRLDIQNALDSALLAAATQPSANRQATAQNIYNLNLTKINMASTSAVFDFSDPNALSASATVSIPTTLIAIAGFKTLSVTAQSSVVIPTVAANGPCIYTLTQGDRGLIVNSGANIIAPKCEIHTHSLGAQTASFNSGINLDLARICIAGFNATDNSQGQSGNVEYQCTPDPDPFAGVLPEPTTLSCDYNGRSYDNSVVNLQPGVYCGSHNFNSSVQQINLAANSGDAVDDIYVFTNNARWNVNGNVFNGDGVTFYFNDTDSAIQFNSGVSVALTPPTSGIYEGFLFAERSGLGKRNMPINDSQNFDIEGIIHLPSKELIFNSGSQVKAVVLTLVADKIIFNNTNWMLEPATSNTPTGIVSTNTTPILIR
ncbi:MAG: pilus assembly protein TadG-related protein [Hyphomicrobiales bacterium]